MARGTRQGVAGAVAAKPVTRRWLWRSHPRLSIAAALFVVMGAILCWLGLSRTQSLLLAFDLAAVAFLAMTARMFSRFSVASVRQRARDQDAGRWSILLCCAAVTGVILVALVVELQAAERGGFTVAVAALSVLLAWLFLNSMFALHYAHRYYGDAGIGAGGLEFPGTRQPDYWDFAYFAFVIGMTFQVSDVTISDRGLRRLALLHSVTAFLFNVVIIALTVNLVAGKA